MPTPLKVFCCSAPEDQKLLVSLTKSLKGLRDLIIQSNLDLMPGSGRAREQLRRLESADIILLLISSDFLASDSCRRLMGRAIDCYNQGSTRVIPVYLRLAFWEEDELFTNFEMIPTGSRAITNWPDPDEAFFNIAEQLSRVIKDIQTKQDTISFQTEPVQEEEENLALPPSPPGEDHARKSRSADVLLFSKKMSESGSLRLNLATLLRELAGDQNEQTMKKAYDHPDLLKTPNIKKVLGALLDPMAFPDLQKFAKGLKRAYERIKKDSVTSKEPLVLLLGTVGLVYLTVELLNISQRQSQNILPEDLDYFKTLIKEPAIWYWLKRVYQPSHTPAILQQGFSKEQAEKNLEVAERHWDELDFESLELYRVGTTSFILRCRSHILTGEHLILKCLLFPYTRVPEIVKATCSYALKYPANGVPATVNIRASSDKWILMDEVVGITLRESLQKRRAINNQQQPLLDIDSLASIGKPLLTALHELSCAGYRHEDLTPSNIMIVKNNQTIERIVLIDLGRNYLYTRDIGLEARREAIFVAPEVKDGRNAEDTSDLYSFGMILIELADPNGAPGGTIPDNLYRYAPDLARFIEDLIDAKPGNRRLLFPLRERNNPYANLQSIFTDLLKILPSERDMQTGKLQIERYIAALFYPVHQLAHAYKLWRITHALSAHPAIARQTGQLYGCLLVNLISRWLIFVVSIACFVRDWGIRFPLPGSQFGMKDLPACLITFSVGLTQVFYPNILAGLTAKPLSETLAPITEFFIRGVAFVALPLVLFVDLRQPNWWPLWLGVGLTVPAVAQILCHRLAVRMLEKAQEELSTVPSSVLDDPSLKTFGIQGYTLLLYICALLIIGFLLLQRNGLSDTWAYTFLAFAINVVILSISKSITLAPGVRGILCRAFTLGERLEHLK